MKPLWDDEEEVQRGWEYRERARQMAFQLPRLGVVGMEYCRNMASVIQCYDFAAPETSGANEWYTPEDNRMLRLGQAQDFTSRLIVVEDLDPKTIGGLGCWLNLPPTVFEAHLRGSGYTPELGQSEPDVLEIFSELYGAAEERPYFSMTWRRAVLPSLPLNEKVRNELLLGQQPTLDCLFPLCYEGKHEVIAKRNIFRSAFSLSARDVDDWTGKSPVAWEERLTICKGQTRDHRPICKKRLVGLLKKNTKRCRDLVRGSTPCIEVCSKWSRRSRHRYFSWRSRQLSEAT
jgi:hypothetical protein